MESIHGKQKRKYRLEMILSDRIYAMNYLGKMIAEKPDWLEDAVQLAYHKNRWFTIENSWLALDAIRTEFLNENVLNAWVSSYPLDDKKNAQKIGLVLAGNIPLVGFHDVLAVFMSGHQSLIKMSSKDDVLLQTLISKLSEELSDTYPDIGSRFQFIDRLEGFDAVIATGSNNSSRYFETYFGKYPNIIRKNRNAIGVLNGDESREDLINLGNDIFQFFGLGCRNVSKIYIPQDYDITILLEVLHEEFKEIIHHNKYKNNFDYNNALFLLNSEPFLMNGCIMVKEAKELTSRISCLHYERYESIDDVSKAIEVQKENIQCVVASTDFDGVPSFRFGQAQKPSISDYADGVDTLEFLASL